MVDDHFDSSNDAEENQRFLETLLGFIPDMVGYWTQDLRCKFANPAYQNWFGKSSEEIIGLPMQSLLGEELFRKNEPYIRAALRGEPQQFERTLSKPTGESCHVFAQYVPDICNGVIQGFLVLIRDITDMKLVRSQLEELNKTLARKTEQAKAAIQEHQAAEAELRIAATAFESQECMMITDANRAMLRVNRAFTEITGYQPDEAIGQSPSILKSGRHDAAFFGAMEESLRRTGGWQGEIWNMRKNGEVFPAWLTIAVVRSKEGDITHYVGALTDMTIRKNAEEQILHLAFYDSLTNLPNRRMLLDRLQQALVTSSRNKRAGALLFIDLDNFKTLNDTLGHEKGDLLLQQVAERLKNCVRGNDTVARFGGDEFVVMLNDLSKDSKEAQRQTNSIGKKILASLNEPYLLGEHIFHSTPSMGATLFNSHENTIGELLKKADLAMYHSKASGRNQLHFFDPEMQLIVEARASMEDDLREGLRKKQFQLHFQPQVSEAGEIIGIEALLRWRHPERGLVTPTEFIEVAESSGLILPLGKWVLDTACAQLSAWSRRQSSTSLTMAVNISARQFRDPTFIDQVLTALRVNQANPHQLMLELTESLLLENTEESIRKMMELKHHGVRFSIDDFGTGYSSLAYLKDLPIDQLKIAQPFLADLFAVDHSNGAITRTILALGQNLNLDVIAEGVETQVQKDFLENNGCHSYQGFLFGHPVSNAEFERRFMH